MAEQGSWSRFFAEKANVTLLLSLVTTLIAVVGGIFTAYAYLRSRESNTYFKVVGADRKTIQVTAWNTGQKHSTLRTYELLADGEHPPLGPSPLLPNTVHPEKPQLIIVTPGAPTNFNLGALDKLPTPCTRAALSHCRDQIFAELDHGKMRLRIEIEESGHIRNLFGSSPYTRSGENSFAASLIREFIEGACCRETPPTEP